MRDGEDSGAKKRRFQMIREGGLSGAACLGKTGASGCQGNFLPGKSQEQVKEGREESAPAGWARLDWRCTAEKRKKAFGETAPRA